MNETFTMNLWDKCAELVKKNFAFLETDFNYELKEAKHPFIWYTSDKIKVGIYYKETGNWSHELDLGVHRIVDNPNFFPSIHVSELIRLSPDSREAENYYAPFPKSVEELEIEVPKLAGLLRKYGSKILKADPDVFEKIERLREERVREINAQKGRSKNGRP